MTVLKGLVQRLYLLVEIVKLTRHSALQCADHLVGLYQIFVDHCLLLIAFSPVHGVHVISEGSVNFLHLYCLCKLFTGHGFGQKFVSKVFEFVKFIL